MSSIVFHEDYIRITYIDYDGVGNFFATHPATVFYHTSAPVGKAGKALLDALHALYPENQEACSKPIIEALLRIVLAEMERNRMENPIPSRVRKAKATWLQMVQYLQENFHYPLTREKVGKAFRLNPTYISRLFTAEGDESFNAMLRRLRLEHTALLLRTTDFNLAEITEYCGYASQTFLAAAFKKQYGRTPGQYRILNQSQ
jgi:AraC-like DNA-binding protein